MLNSSYMGISLRGLADWQQATKEPAGAECGGLRRVAASARPRMPSLMASASWEMEPVADRIPTLSTRRKAAVLSDLRGLGAWNVPDGYVVRSQTGICFRSTWLEEAI